MQMREVMVPEVPGRLFVSDLPGRTAPFEQDCNTICEQGIGAVVCLAASSELAADSPDYLIALEAGTVPWNHLALQLNDRDGIRELPAVLKVIEEAVCILGDGGTVLVHCVNGIGKTGTLAIGILIGIGLDNLEASVRVTDAESGPESGSQEELIEQIARARV